MKNKSVWKTAGIMIALTFLLTWIVPSAQITQDGITIGSIMLISAITKFKKIYIKKKH